MWASVGIVQPVLWLSWDAPPVPMSKEGAAALAHMMSDAGVSGRTLQQQVRGRQLLRWISVQSTAHTGMRPPLFLWIFTRKPWKVTCRFLQRLVGLLVHDFETPQSQLVHPSFLFCVSFH
mmetsp:Transcript_12449/g.34283  ORF Transcript_12449/g.34283 Transcript_12449/m.34283 type:complete len:120 (-) Transcript_12449:119-478(-)